MLEGSPKVQLNSLGIDVTPISKQQLLVAVNQLRRTGKRSVVVGHNLHSSYLCQVDSKFQSVYDQASIILADGKPIEVLLNRQVSRTSSNLRAERLGTTDWLIQWLIQAPSSRVAVIGASKQSNSTFVSQLRSMGQHQVEGYAGEGWNETLRQDAVAWIRRQDPDIVIIGLGMPLQEHFLMDNHSELPQALYILVGGAIDQISGVQKLAPRWLGSFGFEWLWRLALSPKRLSYRYIIEPWRLIFLRTRAISGRRLLGKAPND